MEIFARLLKSNVQTDVYMMKILWSLFMLFYFSLTSDISVSFADLRESEVYYSCCFISPSSSDDGKPVIVLAYQKQVVRFWCDQHRNCV